MNLEDILKKAAYKVWKEMPEVHRDNDFVIFDVREEALTTMALREIYKFKSGNIEKIKMISATAENLQGYDFELVIGSKARGKYIRMFIQAKRLFGQNTNGEYRSLHYDVKRKDNQTDILLSYAKKESSLAMYAFFNHLDEKNSVLKDYYNSSTEFNRKSLGITITSAYSIKITGSNKFKAYHSNNGIRVNQSLYSLRNFPDLFYHHNGTRNNLAVPFHEISYLTIDFAEIINKLYRRIRTNPLRRLNYYYYFPPLDYFFDNGKDLIPILNTSVEELELDFLKREKNESYNPKALIILDTDQK